MWGKIGLVTMASPSTGSGTAPDPRNGRRVRFFVSAMLASAVLCFAATSSASAMEIGLMSADNSWQEANRWTTIQNSGASVFRQMISKGDYYANGNSWSKIDNVFRNAAEHNITILPYLYGAGPTGYSQQFPTEAEWKATGPGCWDQWVNLVVRRYGYNGDFWTEPGHPAFYKPVTAWEVWNEPNFAQNNPGGATVQPENYARFLQHTAADIRAAQTEKGGSTKVLLAGLYSQLGMSTGAFLEGVKNVLGKSTTVFDGLSLHPYSFSEGVQGLQSNVSDARSKLNSIFTNGSSKPLYLTEIGWNVSPGGPTDTPYGDAQHPATNETYQSQWLTESFNWLKGVASEKNIADAIWYIYRDVPTSKSWIGYSGLRRGDGTFRPSWYAFQAENNAPFWPVPEWSSDTMAGNITSDPAASSRGYGSLDLFARGAGNELVHKWYDAGAWNSGWQNLGGTLASGPSSASWSSSRIDVVARSNTNSVLHWGWDGTNWASDTLSGNITSDPEISTWGYGWLDLFAKGTGNELIHKWYGGSWSEWQNLGGGLTSSPAAVSWGPNRIDVFAAGNDHALWHKWFDNNVWSEWQSLGGYITSDPAASSRGSGTLDVFARAMNNELVHIWFENGKWSGWQGLGGTLASGPGAVSWNKDRIDVFARSTSNEVLHWGWGTLSPP